MNIEKQIADVVVEVLSKEYQVDLKPESLLFNETRKEFVGDTTLVLFPFLKQTKQSPQSLGDTLGAACVDRIDSLKSYNVIKGFLNFELTEKFWLDFLTDYNALESYSQKPTDEVFLVEFSSPNTNKPLHLGHVRNILLGSSCANILEAVGKKVIRTQIVNDRGIAVCKSMLSWREYGNGETPESSSTKPDHFVGKYYVLFETKFKEEYALWQETDVAAKLFSERKDVKQDTIAFFKGYKNSYFNKYSEMGAQAKAMLILWENNDPETRSLWEKMNSWVYKGFEETYKALGVSFDTYYYESNTYTLGKDIIEDGLSRGIFYKKDDGSVWIDLEKEGLDHKLVLRSDGTSVYMTQDLGTARLRYANTQARGMVYTVADEQDYHFKALFAILKKLEEPYHDGLFHLSYGMVDLPTGKMKSREGTVVDADDLMKEVVDEARNNSQERGEIEEISVEEREDIYHKIGEAALKFFILKVNPKKRMIFNPAESVDMQGTTGPYVQNAYVRINSISRKAGDMDFSKAKDYHNLEEIEREIIKKLSTFLPSIENAAKQYDPSIIAVYSYELARLYHRFYSDVRILAAESEEAKQFRVQLGQTLARTLEFGFQLLGIGMPERM